MYVWYIHVGASSNPQYYFDSIQPVNYCWIIAVCITPVQRVICYFKFLSKSPFPVYTSTNMFIQSTDDVRTGMYRVYSDTSLPIRPDQPWDACESQFRAQSVPFEQHHSCRKSPQLTGHPGWACHVQTATATGLPRTHCCLAVHQPPGSSSVSPPRYRILGRAPGSSSSSSLPFSLASAPCIT